MRIVVFGLAVSSSWGNGHATLWRGLIRALHDLGCSVVFFERDVPYYAEARDVTSLPGGELALYRSWSEASARAAREIRSAECVIVTSYCPDALAAASLAHELRPPVSAFYDLDTPVTLARLERGEPVDYIGDRGLADFDLVLSYTGGRALELLRERLGARSAAPLYGHVDPQVHRRVATVGHYAADLSYLATYAADRQPALEALLVEPARRRPERRFLIGGAQYPQEFPWAPNIFFVRHVPPPDHAAFYSSSRLTLNVTRAAMARLGWCPSGRLFEAAACGTAVVSDAWEGLSAFFEPGEEIIVARTAEDATAALDLTDAEVRRLAMAARERTLAQHTSQERAHELVRLLEDSRRYAEPERATAEA